MRNIFTNYNRIFYQRRDTKTYRKHQRYTYKTLHLRRLKKPPISTSAYCNTFITNAKIIPLISSPCQDFIISSQSP